MVLVLVESSEKVLTAHLAELDVLVVASKPPGPVLYMRVGKDMPPSSMDLRMFEPR